MRVHFGDFVFDSDAREVRRFDERLHLTPKAFDLLEILVRERPRAVPKQELRDRLWPDVVVADANLKNLIVEIRSAVGTETVRTVQRYGYAFAPSDQPAQGTAVLVDGDRIHALNGGENVIGRDDTCSVVLSSASVSRRHAVIRIAGGRVTLQDLGSKNGTWRNDERLSGPVELRHGDHVRIGSVTMTFRSRRTAEKTVTIEDR